MWSLLTYDFDKTISPDLIFAKIKKHTKAGSILVFHDNIKAEENLKTLLPKTLKYFSEQGYNFKAI
ncbi:MAG: hypothetical protein NTX03_12830 [Bacteroidetes bacterium]|nr:hypothetical protein [Bacteroidota bacterium]